MKAGIIAAGEGSRLRGDGISTLKPLVQVNGTPILERLLMQYSTLGVSQAYCIINEESIQVQEYIEGRNLPISVHFHVKSTKSSMHSLFELAPYLSDNNFLLSTVDSIFDTAELRGFFREAGKLGDHGLLAVTSHDGGESPLWVELDDSNRIVAFRQTESEKPLVTGGLYFFSPRIFDEQSEALLRNINRLRNFLQLLLQKDYHLKGYQFVKMIDLDHAGDIEAAEAFLENVEGNKSLG